MQSDGCCEVSQVHGGSGSGQRAQTEQVKGQARCGGRLEAELNRAEAGPQGDGCLTGTVRLACVSAA